jgi:putative oxidoreductase
MPLAQTVDRLLPYVLSFVRIMTALLLLQHGLSKFFGFPMPTKPPELFSLYWFAGVIELGGGTLLLVGLFSRCAAFVLSGHLAFAYFIGHAPQGFYPLTNRGESAVLFCFVFLILAFTGGGPISIDALRGKR